MKNKKIYLAALISLFATITISKSSFAKSIIIDDVDIVETGHNESNTVLWDEETKTLTLNNFDGNSIELEDILKANIVVNGNNKIGTISAADTYLSFFGQGILSFFNSTCGGREGVIGVYVCGGEISGADIKIEGVTIKNDDAGGMITFQAGFEIKSGKVSNFVILSDNDVLWKGGRPGVEIRGGILEEVSFQLKERNLLVRDGMLTEIRGISLTNGQLYIYGGELSMSNDGWYEIYNSNIYLAPDNLAFDASSEPGIILGENVYIESPSGAEIFIGGNGNRGENCEPYEEGEMHTQVILCYGTMIGINKTASNQFVIKTRQNNDGGDKQEPDEREDDSGSDNNGNHNSDNDEKKPNDHDSDGDEEKGPGGTTNENNGKKESNNKQQDKSKGIGSPNTGILGSNNGAVMLTIISIMPAAGILIYFMLALKKKNCRKVKFTKR